MLKYISITLPLLTALVTAKMSMTNYYEFEPVYNHEIIQTPINGNEIETADLLGLGNRPQLLKEEPSLSNSASRFLLEVYGQINDQEEAKLYSDRHKRSLDDNNFITPLDRLEIEKCNNIITFSSKNPNCALQPWKHDAALYDITDTHLYFNTNDVPSDLQLMHSALRLYQDPAFGRYYDQSAADITISVYRRVFNRKQEATEFRLFNSINSTTAYKGWLEINMTRLMDQWIESQTLQEAICGNELLLGVVLTQRAIKIHASDIGLVSTHVHDELQELQPFLIGYFNGPDLMDKIQELRMKREASLKLKRNTNYYRQRPPPIPKVPKTCERANFTLDFKELEMDNWVIAPKNFEAYYCGGECNFPLSSKMNATNHAIVQTLMHLKRPHLPKPCCVPTELGSISILRYLNDDSVNLRKYRDIVAKECGCH